MDFVFWIIGMMAYWGLLFKTELYSRGVMYVLSMCFLGIFFWPFMLTYMVVTKDDKRK